MFRLSLHQISVRVHKLCRDFQHDAGGQIVILFAICSTVIVFGLGASFDLAIAYSARQRLSEIATLACQYSTRPSVSQTANSTYTGANGFQTYVNAVNTYATTSLQTQHWAGTAPVGPTGISNAYFTATPAVGGSGAGQGAYPTNLAVEMAASIPTSFMQVLHVSSIPVHAKIACPTSGTTPQIVNSPVLVQEGFETACSGYCFTPANGSSLSNTPRNSFPSSPQYVGSTGVSWSIMGYCLETDSAGIINSTVPEGSHAAEFDCDNGGNSAGNSSLSTKVYLANGSYELRYFYRSRVDYPNYDPAYICGSTASDVSWANDTNSAGGPRANALRTNQINVYLDQNLNGTAPLHTTIDGTQSLAGSNLIDVCVYSLAWVERSVRITVTTPAYYWLSFAADGTNDSFGAQLDNIRLCQASCPGTVQDNFPATWLAVNNSGVNKILFEDKFEAPVYTTDPYASSAHAKGGNLANSYGVTAPSACGNAWNSPPGWPCQMSAGWATAPFNEVEYWMQGATQGTQYIALQGANTFTSASDPLNRAISRPFLLDPGYYNISYYYTSLMDFSYDFIYGVTCTAVPTTANSYNAYGIKHGHDYGNTGTLYAQYLSTNFMNLYMSNGQLISTPTINGTLGGAPMYNNPDGTTTSSPAVPPDGGTIFAAYNASAVNPVLDTCSYSSAFAWTPRSVNIKISKAGLYWLTFSSQGDPLTGPGSGPAIDDVKLTALGSPYMSNPPSSNLVAIPVPAPQPGSSLAIGSYSGFTITADPFAP